MFRINYFLVGLISYFVAQSNVDAVSFIKPCKAVDKECMLSSAQAAVKIVAAGLPELGVLSSDPLPIKSVKSDEGGLSLAFTDVVITGVSKCKFLEVERDTQKNTIKLEVECPIHATGQSDMKGKLLIFQIFGSGGFKISTEKARITVLLKIKDIEKNGLKYWKVTGFDYSYDILDKVQIDLKNLYDGDEKRAAPVLAAIREAGNEIVKEVGDGIIKQVISNYVDVAKKCFLAWPIAELELA